MTTSRVIETRAAKGAALTLADLRARLDPARQLTGRCLTVRPAAYRSRP
jgi:hypothetical protein